MQTHDITRSDWFWGIDKAYSVPFLFRTTVREAEYPYRASMATGLHCYPGKAILLGKWGVASTNPEKHLLDALQGRFVATEKIPGLAEL